MTNLRNLLTEAIHLVAADWGGTSATSTGNVWLKEARDYLAALPAEPKAEWHSPTCDVHVGRPCDCGGGYSPNAREPNGDPIVVRLFNEIDASMRKAGFEPQGHRPIGPPQTYYVCQHYDATAMRKDPCDKGCKAK